jgi:hypothetical protein
MVGKVLCSVSRLRQPSPTLVGGRRKSNPASIDSAEPRIFGVDTSTSRTFYAGNSRRQSWKEDRVVLDKKAMKWNKQKKRDICERKK